MSEVMVRINVPEIATKQLRFRRPSGRRVLTVSSNLLTLFGFEKGDRVVEESIGPGMGIVIRKAAGLPDEVRTKMVYSRSYPRRRNNPLEHLIEVSSQRLIDESFPAECSRVHVEFTQGMVRITPIVTVAEKARSNAFRAAPLSVFAALTSGVDLSSMREEGFSVSAVLEWRPQEARDKTDLTETGMMAALSNSGPVFAAFNEDVTACVLDRIGRVMERHPVMVLHASPQCDDHSNLKSRALKDRDTENGTSTADMIIDLLNVIERVAPPVVIFENVPGMIGSAAYEIASLRLRRWGYARHEHVGDARDYGGLTSRKRAYVVFTQLEAAFSFEAPTERRKDAWRVVNRRLHECRDVSHSKALRDGKECGRLRAVRPGATSLPTPVKSQGRMAKDSIVIEPEDGRFMLPSEGMLKDFLGVSDTDLNAVSATIATEIVGQSVDGPHHGAIMRAVRRHISAWRAGRSGTDGFFRRPPLS